MVSILHVVLQIPLILSKAGKDIHINVFLHMVCCLYKQELEVFGYSQSF